MKSKNLTLASLFAGLFMFMNPMGSEACTRAVYLGPDDMVVTGRTMIGKRTRNPTCISSPGAYREGERYPIIPSNGPRNTEAW